MKKYMIFFMLSMIVFCSVLILSMNIDTKNKINKDALFSLLVENYCSGTISYEECNKFYKRYFSNNMNDSTLQTYNTLLRVKESKENYRSASSHYDQKHFIRSYNLFALVIEEDIENYGESLRNKKCIIRDVVSEIEFLTRSHDYDKAVAMFEEMNQYMDLSIDLSYRLEKSIMSLLEED